MTRQDGEVLYIVPLLQWLLKTEKQRFVSLGGGTDGIFDNIGKAGFLFIQGALDKT